MQVRIFPSAMIRRDYNTVAELCRDTGEPIFFARNGAGDLVAMTIEAYLQMDWRVALRENLVGIEQQRRGGAKDLSSKEVFGRLYEIVEKYKLLELTEESEYPERG